jgi:ATP adenylyltransferase
MSDLLYDLDAARFDEQLRRMQQLEQAGICIFCPAHVAEHHPKPVRLSSEHWYVTENAFPYTGTVEHYLIVARRHVRAFDELPDEAGGELWAIKRELKAQFTARATGTVERSGDMRLNGGSIAHLHVHFVVLDEDPSSTVRFRLSARGPDDRQPASELSASADIRSSATAGLDGPARPSASLPKPIGV